MKDMPDTHGMGKRALKAAQNCTTVAHAYLAVMSDCVITVESYTAYKTVFQPSGSKQPELFRLVAMCSRKNSDFQAKETLLIRVAAKELEQGPRLLKFLAGIEDPEWFAENIGDVIAALPTLRTACRPGATTKLEELAQKSLKSHAQTLSAQEGDADLEELQTCLKHLDFFATSEASAASLQECRVAMSDRLRQCEASTATQEIVQLAKSVEDGDTSKVTSSGFIACLDSCKGHALDSIQEPLKNIATSLESTIATIATTLTDVDNGSCDKFKQVGENFLLLCPS
jgi:hypothetical protein